MSAVYDIVSEQNWGKSSIKTLLLKLKNGTVDRYPGREQQQATHCMHCWWKHWRR